MLQQMTPAAKGLEIVQVVLLTTAMNWHDMIDLQRAGLATLATIAVS